MLYESVAPLCLYTMDWHRINFGEPQMSGVISCDGTFFVISEHGGFNFKLPTVRLDHIIVYP